MAQPNFRRYFLYALLIKGVLLFLFAFLFNKGGSQGSTINYIFKFSRDYSSYISPSINLVEKGIYYEDDAGKKLYAHKMPGMAPVFAPLYYCFGFNLGLTFLVIIQFLTDALCCVLLGIIALRVFKRNQAFYLAFFAYSFSSIVSIGSHNAVSELFCTSFSIIAVYFMIRGKSIRNYLFAGLFATWSVFFRPTSIILFLTLPLFLFLNDSNKFSLKNVLDNKKKLLILFFPFVFFESIWIVRNYIVLNRFVPAEISAENFGSPGMKSVFSMLLDFGGDLQSWNPDSEMRWFNNRFSENYDSAYSASFPFPDYVISSGVKREELITIRDNYCKYDDPTIPMEKKLELEREIALLCKQASKKFKTQAPFTYYVIAPLRTLKMLVFIKRPYGFSFSNNGIFEKAVRAWHFVCYYVPLLLFLISFVWIFKIQSRQALLIAAIVFLHLILYGFILRFTENRYVVPVYPYMVVILTGTLLYFFDRFGKQTTKPNTLKGI